MRVLKSSLLFLSVCAMFFAQSVRSDGEKPDLKYAVPQEGVAGYVARIELHTVEEIEQLLKRAEAYLENADAYPESDPIAVILHGPEVQLFNKLNYSKFKDIVGLAARLDALNVINVQVCEVQLLEEGLSISDLPHFVESVPYGPAEEERLLKKGYQYF